MRKLKSKENSKGMVAFVEAGSCDGSPACAAKRICPQKAISQKGTGILNKIFGGGTAAVDESKCTACGICVSYCPHGAIKMKNR